MGTPPTAPPSAAKAAIKARVLEATLGSARPALLDGRYLLLREIGRGGIGVLWEARQEPLGRRVAIKFLRGHAKRFQARLLAEAQTVALLEHPHIVQVYDVGTDIDGSPYLVMELLCGPSLASYLSAKGILREPEVRRIALQLCDALAAAHRQGLVHRDVKPANVLATSSGPQPGVWKLVDFGLSTHAEDASGPVKLKESTGGTPGYMPPEQIRGEKVDSRSDVYSMGCVLYEMLTGRPAFTGRSTSAIVQAQLDQKLNADSLRPPKAWDAIVQKAMHPIPAERFGSIALMAESIRALDQPPRKSRGGFHPLWSFILGVITTLAIVAAAVSWQAFQRSDDAGSHPREQAAPTHP